MHDSHIVIISTCLGQLSKAIYWEKNHDWITPFPTPRIYNMSKMVHLHKEHYLFFSEYLNHDKLLRAEKPYKVGKIILNSYIN